MTRALPGLLRLPARPHIERPVSAAAGTFGILTLLIALILHGEDRKRRYDDY